MTTSGDVYSIGKILMFIKDVTVGAKSIMAVPLHTKAHREPFPAWSAVTPASIDVMVERLILECLSENPRRRPSMAAVEAELSVLIGKL